MSNHDIWEIQKGSRWVDRLENQNPEMAYTHSMSNGKAGQSAEDAIAQRDEFKKNALAMAQSEHKNGQEYGATDAAMEQFGVAMHPVMDSLSPAHVDDQGKPRPWGGSQSNGSEHSLSVPFFGDRGGIEKVSDLNNHPERQDSANKLIRAAYETMTGLVLNCNGQ